MIYTGERAIPWVLSAQSTVFNAHVQRYAWALPYVMGKKVVDLGCGTGYGTFMLSWVARQAIGVDIDIDSIAFATRRFQAANLQFAAMDITKTRFNGEVYVAFEVLEHLDDPEEVIAKYRPLLWSIPIGDDSKFHKRAYSIPEILDLMGKCSTWQDRSGAIGVHWDDLAYVLGVLT